jgi:hypothetical protein
MDEQKKLKYEDAVIQNNLNFLNNLKIKILEPYSNISINFLNSLSFELKKNKNTFISPELFSLMLFCSKKNILKFKKKFKKDQFRVGRGLAFHVCPSNVPVNFMFSFILGLLSGNTNIVKVSSKASKEKDIILENIYKVLKSKKYLKLKKTNFFIEYNHQTNQEITTKLSSLSDCRIIWGGDKTVKTIKDIYTQPRCVDINFADRYSLSLINTKKFNKLSKLEIDILARKYFYDVFTMNQMACNSPHFIFWIGKSEKRLEEYFWKKISKIAFEKFKFDDVHVMKKYNDVVDKLMNIKFIKKITKFDNYLYLVNVDNKIMNIENIRGNSGTVYQIKLKRLDNLSKLITKKCQTITHFGFQDKDFKNLVLKNNLLGADRVVKIGQAFEFDLNWDGFDTIESLTRVISLK